MTELRVIDIDSLVKGRDPRRVAEEIGAACRECGFFYIVGHGVDVALQQRLERLSRDFFAQPRDEKLKIRMELGGAAWRGFFPVGQELTSGKPDRKEGIYFGAELPADHPMVEAGTPLHGQNLFPENPPELRAAVLDYIDVMTRVGHTLMRGIAVSLGLDESYFFDHYTADPLVLFRIFNYPAEGTSHVAGGDWGVGEHTDYGLLTILRQDAVGGLEVKSQGQWIAAPPIEDSFICNIGDMLDRMTAGHYRSTPHRVRNVARRDRLSFPFFFDPNWHARVRPIELPDTTAVAADRDERWDHVSVHEFGGTYGEYVLGKVAKVFPHLFRVAL
jgi:isopenicillin N synthase-like dioxygenase